uniref:DUF1802 family protein n=1 Tax=Schlesneria paludicola TaxID=360056 RepID=A0A7C4LN01_9PLAN
MLSENRFAFKEWASVCAALAAGRQCLILRKGGLHEPRGGFRVEQDEFWLFPTHFHQQPEALIDGARVFHEQAQRECPAAGTIALQLYAVVEHSHEINDAALLSRLTGLHIWSERTVHDRFHYRRPGLCALVVRVYRRPAPYVLPDSPHFAGCRSWVDLPTELSTEGLQPVLATSEQNEMTARIARALTPSAWV